VSLHLKYTVYTLGDLRDEIGTSSCGLGLKLWKVRVVGYNANSAVPRVLNMRKLYGLL